MDFHNKMEKLLKETYNVSGRKLAYMLQYAEKHAEMEQAAALTVCQNSNETLLPVSLRVLDGLKLEDKVVIFGEAPDLSVSLNVSLEELQMYIDSEALLCAEVANELASRINTQLEGASGIRINALVRSLAVISEKNFASKLCAHMSYEIIK